MSPFVFPQPGKRANAVAIPVPIHTLRALLGAALAWEIDTDATVADVVPPQVRDATLAALASLSEEDVGIATRAAERMLLERLEAEEQV